MRVHACFVGGWVGGWVNERASVRVRACARACVCAYVRTCVCTCVCVCGGGVQWMRCTSYRQRRRPSIRLTHDLMKQPITEGLTKQATSFKQPHNLPNTLDPASREMIALN